MEVNVQTNLNLNLGPLGQIARRVGDIKASTAWFRDVLGLPHLFTFGTLSFFDCAGVRLFLQQGEGSAENSILYFRVADIHAAAAALKERGVRFLDAPHMIHRHQDGTEEWMTFFKDPDSQPLGLMSQIKR
jgi:catechol 2,3-dioxygenase-like lactoylglutathione lyase family enzyme